MSYFNFPTKEEVELAIQKELKDVSYESKSIQVGKYRLAPYQTESQFSISTSRGVDNAFYIFPITNNLEASKANNLILEHLQNGASGLKIIFENQINISLEYFEKMLENVRLDYIYTVLVSSNIDVLHSFSAFVNSLKYELPQNRLFTNYISISSENFESNAHKAINIEGNIWYNIELTGDFYLDLCRIRAFRILKSNYAKLSNSNHHFILTASTQKPDENNDNPPNFLLNLTTQSVSAILGTADGIEIAKIGSGNDDFDNRMSRNIFNLINEESYLTLVQDPTHGSYFFENYTHLIAKSIYESIH